jgi:hypothetical protein
MKIYIKGKCNHVTKKRIKNSIRFYANKLMTVRLTDKISIWVKCIHMEGDEIATCTWLDDNRRPKEFEIELKNNISVRRTLMVLAHEMVHVKQYAKSELVDNLKKNAVSFKGKVYAHSETAEEKYWDSPWEIEAFGRELGLYLSYMDYEKLQKKS